MNRRQKNIVVEMGNALAMWGTINDMVILGIHWGNRNRDNPVVQL
jgi:hypothetical protein